jgi:RNA polymerase sigma-70 factor (ECF subfamily)
MVQDEAVLLQRFVATGDAGAFSEIVRLYASLVYSACMRILGDREAAADATQETFFQFMKKANTIADSIPAWLHRVATGKAVDRIRAESARRRAEGQYAEVKRCEVGKWEDLSPFVDEALEALDAPSRELLIAYFFEGRALVDIGAGRGLSHATVSRRVKAAVSQLRAQLRRSGVVVSTVALGALLGENAAQAAPAVVLSELAKMAIAGAELCAPVAIGGLLLAAKAKVIVVAFVMAIGAVGVLTHRHFTRPVENSGPAAVVEPAVVVKEEPTDSGTPDVSDPMAVEAEGSNAPAESIQPNEAQAATQTGTPEPAPAQPPNEAQATTQTRTPEPAPAQPLEQEPPQETTQEDQTPEFDLSTPHATSTTFIKMLVASDIESVMACMLPDGTHYDRVEKFMLMQPGDFNYDQKLCLQALDPDAEMAVTEQNDTPDGVEIVWLVTFKTDFNLRGKQMYAGEQGRFGATVIPVDGQWLINSIIPNMDD